MRVITYSDLELSKVKKSVAKVVAAIERDDFKSADVKKLAQGTYYRARLEDAHRLLLQFVHYRDETVCLVLEVILNHAYDRSRFLRGAIVDEHKIVDATAEMVQASAESVRYLHPKNKIFRLLDKVISFDDTQEEVFHTPAPLVLVGSAGSGKTALTLERLRQLSGTVLYVTQSAFLAKSASELFFAHGFENPNQEPDFLSFKEFLETLKVPNGREVRFSEFRWWFERFKSQFKFTDAHQVFEEFKGVLTSNANGVLKPEEYLVLGVKQSIYAESERAGIYDLFLKYKRWLEENNLFDVNLVSFDWQKLALPTYDFIVVDEVQDLTMVQLALILKTLKVAGQFLLCGDSNQIVHPNMFAWSAVKTLFWQDEALAAKQQISVLRVNFRNATEVTKVANSILKVKHARFGSIDKESNFLVEPVAEAKGLVESLPNKDVVKKKLNDVSKASTQYAVLVLRDEDKALAKSAFQTPLIFSIHEAKGLEYENVILYNMISSHRQTFSQICEGVTLEDLQLDSLEYRRGKDKSDKSLEIYKFYINALYVALTRATQKVYLIESDQTHPLLNLLEVKVGTEQVKVEGRNSSRADWEREAIKLELQGKLEQAEAIRSNILKVKPVPWDVLNEAAIRTLEQKSFDKAFISAKSQKALLEYAVYHRQYDYIFKLHDMKFMPATGFLNADAKERGWQQKSAFERFFAPIKQQSESQILLQCDEYGVDHRTLSNATPLMLAAQHGNLKLVTALLERGANPALTDHFGHTAYFYALNRALTDEQYCKTQFSSIHDLLSPAILDVQVEGKLIRLYPYMAEYYFLQVMLAQTKFKPGAFQEEQLSRGVKLTADQWVYHLSKRKRFMQANPDMTLDAEQIKRDLGIIVSSQGERIEDTAFFNADNFRLNIDVMPENVLLEKRKKRSYFNAVLARAEKDSTYKPSRQLWVRVKNGFYQPNPSMLLRVKQGADEIWKPIAQLLGSSINSK